jgi:hypothetical protein
MQAAGVHPTLHPAAPGSGPNAGVAVGAFVQSADQGTRMHIGYGEGWARLGKEGEVEIRSTPQAAFVSYAVPIATGEMSVSFRPSLGTSIFRSVDKAVDVEEEDDVTTSVVLQPGVTLLFQSGALYAAPRIGAGHGFVVEGDSEGQTVATGGATIGGLFGGGVSGELSVLYSQDLETDESVWSIVPTIGISVGK